MTNAPWTAVACHRFAAEGACSRGGERTDAGSLRPDRTLRPPHGQARSAAKRWQATAVQGAFTLVELIVVMGLLAVVLAFTAPSLGRSMRQRNLESEAVRFLAATEYARDEAVSQGVPMVLWIDDKQSRFGVEAKDVLLGAEARDREFALHPDVQVELEKSIGRNAKVQPVEFTPDGSPATTNVELVTLKDRFDSAVMIARTDDGWGYEILKEEKK